MQPILNWVKGKLKKLRKKQERSQPFLEMKTVFDGKVSFFNQFIIYMRLAILEKCENFDYSLEQ